MKNQYHEANLRDFRSTLTLNKEVNAIEADFNKGGYWKIISITEDIEWLYVPSYLISNINCLYFKFESISDILLINSKKQNKWTTLAINPITTIKTRRLLRA